MGSLHRLQVFPCMLNDDIAKPTRIRAWCIRLPSMRPVCAWYPSKKRFSCVGAKENPHVLLSTNKTGGKRMSTWKAAACQPGTVAASGSDTADRSKEILVRAPSPAVTSQPQPVLLRDRRGFGYSASSGRRNRYNPRNHGQGRWCHSARTSRRRWLTSARSC